MMPARKLSSPGPFTVNDIREEDRFELSNGHRIYCAPAGENHACRNLRHLTGNNLPTLLCLLFSFCVAVTVT